MYEMEKTEATNEYGKYRDMHVVYKLECFTPLKDIGEWIVSSVEPSVL
jgi:hypothetical protein